MIASSLGRWRIYRDRARGTGLAGGLQLGSCPTEYAILRSGGYDLWWKRQLAVVIAVTEVRHLTWPKSSVKRTPTAEEYAAVNLPLSSVLHSSCSDEFFKP